MTGTELRKVVLDVLKPHQPPIQELASRLTSLRGVEFVNVSLREIDQSTESVKVCIEGPDIGIDAVRKKLEDLGAVIHSIDEVSVSKKRPVSSV